MERPFQERLTKSIREAAKKLLPEAVIRELRQLQAYDRHERKIYVKLRALSGLAMTNPKTTRAPKTTRRFLFVCFGNIMRSPMCEALMNQELAGFNNPQFSVSSAGLNATPGRPAHPWAIGAAPEFGVSLEQHRARLVTQQAVDRADAIFVMDCQNQVQLLARWATARDKVFMLAAYAGREYRSVEIPDPYYLGEEQTRVCYQTLYTCIHNLALRLAD